MNKKMYASPILECEKIVTDFLMNSANVYETDGELIFDSGFFYGAN